MRTLVGLVLGLAACATAQESTAVSRGFRHEEALRRATVYIRECGTGWLVSENYVVTNAHVLDCVEAREHAYVSIDFSDGTTMKGHRAGRSSEPFVDLALIQLDGPIQNDVLPLGTAEHIPSNTLLVSIGNPTPVTWMPTMFRVLVQPEKVEGGLDGVLVLEGLALAGDSGAPLMTLDGKVVGVVYARTDGHAYAVPVQPYLVDLLRSVMPRRTWP